MVYSLRGQVMEIYVEYALIENFLFDGVLLCLAIKAARAQTTPFRLIVSALCGAIFALLYPLLILPKILAILLKIAVGFLLCFIAIKDVKTKKEWGRYAWSCVFFFIFSFSFGGILLAITDDFFQGKVPSWCVFAIFFALTICSCVLIKRFYIKKQLYQYIYACEITTNGKIKKAMGFWDSGNLAKKHGFGICFLSPELFYELFEDAIFVKGQGQVCDELKIQTLGGEKSVRLYLGEIQVQTAERKIKKQVYFAPSRNMISREYSILLPSGIFEEGDGTMKNKKEKSA